MSTTVTFILAPEIVEGADSGVLLGDFNNWNYDNGISLQKQQDGSLQAIANLEPGKTYQYRYLLNDGRWVNDARANSYVHADGFYVDNCVITVVEEEAPVAEEIKEAVIIDEAPAAKPVKEKTAKAKKTATKSKAAVAPADDLGKIKGINKEVKKILLAENIASFKDLAKSSGKKLKNILDAAAFDYAKLDIVSWPKQAKLAADSKWDDLKDLQKELKAK